MRFFAFCVLTFILIEFPVFQLLPATFAEEDTTLYKLRYKYEPSEFIHYKVDAQSTIDVQLNQNKQITTNSSKTLKHYRVVSVDESGNGTLEMVIDRVRMKVQFDKQAPSTFDSGDPNQKDLKQFEKIRQNIGQPKRMVCSPLGKVISVNDPKEAQTTQNVPLFKEPKKQKEEKQSRGFMIPLPEHKVKVGDSWKESYDVEVAVGKKLRKKVPIGRTFTLESVEDQVAVIKFKTKILQRLNDPKLRLQLIQKTPSGTIKLDIEKGVIILQDVSLDKAQVGVFNGKGAMRAISTTVETLVDPADVAQLKASSSLE